MRHLKKGRKFGRTSDQRRSLYKVMLGQLILRERVQTSEAKAREIGPMMERLVTKAKRGGLAMRRELGAKLPDGAAQKLLKTVAPKFASRSGGYTRIIKLPERDSDSSRRAIIEFVE